ncbi:MAG TPA: DUF4349 domain-containing protein [Terriglobales bacterium]|nr:DUF4349 domain-containing protein [Terriglobales bacterium]
MVIRWGVFSTKSRPALKTGWLIAAGVVALYWGVIPPRDQARGIASEKASGLAAVSGGVGWEPLSLWRQTPILPHFKSEAYLQKGMIGGVAVDPAVVAPASLITFSGERAGAEEDTSEEDRKLVRTESLGLIVPTPAETAEKIIQIAQGAGGFLVTSIVSGGAEATSASLSIRVPAEKFDEVRAQIRKLSLRVESDGIDAQDVTKQYVDQEARLRNLQAQEQQYLGILRKAATVKDTLEVSDKLNEVRGAIEEKQAEFEALSKQVETLAINITLRAEADAQVFGLNWRPLYQLKIAAREGLDGFGEYAASMTTFVFYLPSILLWLFTILAGAGVGWRILKWSARKLFISPKTDMVEKAVS